MLKAPAVGSNLTLTPSKSLAITSAIRIHPRSTRVKRLPLSVSPVPLLYPGIQGGICRQAIRAQAAAEAGTPTGQADAQQQAGRQVEEVQAAWAYLKEFTLKTFRGMSAPYTSTAEKRTVLRDALLLVFQNPWPAAGWVPPRQHQHSTGIVSSPQSPTTAPGQTSASSQTSGSQASAPSAVSNSPASAQIETSRSSKEATGNSTSSGKGGVMSNSTEVSDASNNTRVSSNSGSAVSISEKDSSNSGGSSRQGESSSGGGLVMIGLMASDVRVGARAMRDYCAALGLPYSKPESRVPGVTSVAAIQGTVYMKYNSQSQLCYVSPYFGKERGVLVQLGVEQLGHFPLGLFDEAMVNPPPAL